MLHLLWDASALAKRYYDEVGSDAVDTLFESTATRCVLTFLGYAEIAVALTRKRNAGLLTSPEFADARSLAKLELLDSPAATLLSITDGHVVSGISLADRYNLNSSDAAVLRAYLAHAGATSDTSVLVASDSRLLRAAVSEGLTTLNPETISVTDAAALVATLE